MNLNKNEKIAATVGVVVVFGVLIGGTSIGRTSHTSMNQYNQDNTPLAASAANSVPVAELQMTDVETGTGARAESGSKVTVHYTGMLEDGAVFDSSNRHGQPFIFTLGQGHVILGWEMGIQGMREGGKRRLIIPPQYGYGSNGVPGAIPPNATLIFDVELVSVAQ